MVYIFTLILFWYHMDYGPQDFINTMENFCLLNWPCAWGGARIWGWCGTCLKSIKEKVTCDMFLSIAITELLPLILVKKYLISRKCCGSLKTLTNLPCIDEVESISKKHEGNESIFLFSLKNVTLSIDCIHEQWPRNFSFVYALIILTGLALKQKFFWILFMLMRLARMIRMINYRRIITKPPFMNMVY